MLGTVGAINFLSGSRVTINQEPFDRFKAEQEARATSNRRITVNLPGGVRVFGAANDESYEQREHLIFAGVEPNRTKILFLDYHQVLDRSSSETTYNTGKIPEINVRVVTEIVDYAANRGTKLFVFILSYTVDRTQHILDSLEATPSIIPRLSGVIITPSPTGRSGKSAVIYNIRESLNVPGLQSLLVDDSADVLEECNQWLSDFNAIHVKLKRKRSLEGGVAYRSRKYLEDAVPDLERFIEE